ncbi:MAG: hypothetical protein J2O48_05320 [Solirubrobacterales bacterium]|nr:hypothetical protein [Solirubrobacterales bacterium]
MAKSFSRPAAGAVALSTVALLVGVPAGASAKTQGFRPGSLAVAATTYPTEKPDLTVGQPIPTWNPAGQGSSNGIAVADGTYPYAFNNDGPDGSFAVSSAVNLLDVNNGGHLLDRYDVPTSEQTTSFSSKSELALNLSTDGQDLTWSGYNAAPGALDASNSNTPYVYDATNPDIASMPNSPSGTPGYFRRVGDYNVANSKFSYTDTNDYSGDNGRAALLDNAADEIFMAGNSNNGSTSTAQPLVNVTGAQSVTPGQPADTVPSKPLASFSTQQIGATKVDKPGKDTNFRGLTEFNGVVYYTKGSGSNGVNTVYFIDTTGNACPNGTGLPAPGAPLPTQTGATYKMCILKGFNTGLASAETKQFPFGLWFANKDTLYVADEGDGGTTYDPTTNTWADAAPSSPGGSDAGLQKWVFDGTQWNLAYTIQNGLNLGQPYSSPVKGYPTGNNSGNGGTNLPWNPANDGLRNISGHVNSDGSATIYATTSTVSGSGDPGADPNSVVAVTDKLASTTAGTDRFRTVEAPRSGFRYGGVAWLPNK